MSNEKRETLNRIFKHIGLQFFVIFGCNVISISIIRYMQNQEPISYYFLFCIMGFSLLGAIPTLILLIGTDISEKAMKIRWVIHFLVLEIVIIVAAMILEIVKEPIDAAVLFAEVAVIYVIVRLFDWENDRKIAKQINEGLKKRKSS